MTSNECLEANISKQVVAAQPLGVAILSLPDLRFVVVNEAARRVSPVPDLIGRTLPEALPRMSERVVPLLERVAETGGPFELVDVAMPVPSYEQGSLPPVVYVTARIWRFDIDGESFLCACITDTSREVTARTLLEEEKARTEEMLAKERETARLGRMLAECDQLVHSTLDFESIAKGLVEIGCEALGTDVGSIAELANGCWMVKFEHGFGPDHASFTMPEAYFPVSLFAQWREPLVLHDVAIIEGPSREQLDAFGVKSLMAIPLYTRDVVTGAMMFARTDEARPFSEMETEFARSLGVSASFAIQNATAYRSKRDLAETLQDALLAMPERLTGVSYARAYRSASETAQVGGDFYDLIQLGAAGTAITTGDISGKGLDAAVLTSLVKNTLRGHAMDSAATPATAMKAANEVLFHATAPHVFATVFFGILDSTNGHLAYCNAGHTPAFLRRTNGTVTSLKSNCPLVGAFTETSFRDSEVFLQRDDLLFLYTDGLLEARSGDDMFGEERIQALLERDAASDPEEAIRLVLDSVSEFTRGALSDDMALLAVSWTPPSGAVAQQQQLDIT